MEIAHLPRYSLCVLEALNSQRQVGQHCDVMILAGNNIKLTAHSCVLAAISPFLLTMVPKTPVNQRIELCLADYSPEILQICLDMVYTGNLQIPQEDSSGLLLDQVRYVANALKMEPVIAACQQISFDKSKRNSSGMCPEEGLPIACTDNLSTLSARPSCHSVGLHQMKKENQDQDISKACSKNNHNDSQGTYGSGSTNMNHNLSHTETILVKSVSPSQTKNPRETEDFMEKDFQKYGVRKSEGNRNIECKDTSYSKAKQITSTLHSLYVCHDILELSSTELQLEGYVDSKSTPTEEVALESKFGVGDENIGKIPVQSGVRCGNDADDPNTQLETCEKLFLEIEEGEKNNSWNIPSGATKVLIRNPGANTSNQTFNTSKPHLTWDHFDTSQKKVHIEKETIAQTNREVLPSLEESTLIFGTSPNKISDSTGSTEGVPRLKHLNAKFSSSKESMSTNIGTIEGQDGVHCVKPGSKLKSIYAKQTTDNFQQTRRSRRLAKKELWSAKHTLTGKGLKRGLETHKHDEQAIKWKKQGKICKILKDIERRHQLEQSKDSHDQDEVYELSKEEADQAEVLKSFSSITSELLRLQRDGMYDPHVPVDREVEGENPAELRLDTGIVVEEGDVGPDAVQTTFMEVVKAIARIKEGRSIDKIKTDVHQNSAGRHIDRNEVIKVLGVPKTGAHMEDWKNCKYCSKYKGKKKGRYAFHVQYCHSQYKCTFCFKPFLNEHDLAQHKCDLMNVFICHLCGKVLRNKAALHLHMKHHKGEKNKICQHCGKAFTRSCYLQAHIARAHSKDRPYQCEHCDAAYALKFELNRHMYKHSTDPNFICETCGDKFYERSKWVFHKKAKHSSSVDSSKENNHIPSFVPPSGMTVFHETWHPELPCITPGGSTVLETSVHGLELVSTLQTTKADPRVSEVHVNAISGMNSILEQVSDVVNDIPQKGISDNIHNQWIIYQIDAQGHLSYQGNIQ